MKSTVLFTLILACIPLFGMEKEFQHNTEFIQKIRANVPVDTKVVVLNENPPILLLKNFLTKEEMKHIKKIASERFERSKTDSAETSEHRTSSTAFLFFNESEQISHMVNRAAKMFDCKPDQAELQAVKYLPGQEFKPHYDAGGKNQWGSEREISMFIYLNELDESAGGETEFPLLNLKVRPEKYAALVWRNIDYYGFVDGKTLHAGRPVVHGEKWGTNLFFHDKTLYYNKSYYQPFNTVYRKACSVWNYLVK